MKNKIKLSTAQRRIVVELFTNQLCPYVYNTWRFRDESINYFMYDGRQYKYIYNIKTFMCLAAKGVLKLTHTVHVGHNLLRVTPITDEDKMQIALNTLTGVDYLVYTLTDKVKVDINVEVISE
jgi:hypothetical protein